MNDRALDIAELKRLKHEADNLPWTTAGNEVCINATYTYMKALDESANALFNRIEALEAAAKEVLVSSYSGTDVRLLAVGLGGSKVTDAIHERCDRMTAAQDAMRAVLFPVEPEPK